MDTTTACPETTSGSHVWDAFTIPARVHDADGRVETTPARTVRECVACLAQEGAR